MLGELPRQDQPADGWGTTKGLRERATSALERRAGDTVNATFVDVAVDMPVPTKQDVGFFGGGVLLDVLLDPVGLCVTRSTTWVPKVNEGSSNPQEGSTVAVEVKVVSTSLLEVGHHVRPHVHSACFSERPVVVPRNTVVM